MKDKIYKELKKKYTDAEIAESFVLPSHLTKKEQVKANKEFSEFLKKHRANKSNKMGIEIERKFLLKRLPDVKYSEEVKEINQYYCSGKSDFRLREVTQFGKKTKYYQTVKERISDMSYKEDEWELTKKEFHDKLKTVNKCIAKDRHIKRFGKLKWEIDVYENMRLVVAEIEIPSEKHHLILPKYIKDNLIMEVTSFRNFTNRSLAQPAKYKNGKLYV